MVRYYDQRTEQCAKGCVHCRAGVFPDGRPYTACEGYGIILSDVKPVTSEPCEKYSTDIRVTTEEIMAQKRAAEASKRRRKY